MIPDSGERSHQDLSLRTGKFHVATITDDLHVLNAESSCLLSLIAAPQTHLTLCISMDPGLAFLFRDRKCVADCFRTS